MAQKNTKTDQDNTTDTPELAPDPTADLRAEVESLKARLARIEQAAHTDHMPDAAALDHITTHVMGHVHEHLHKAMGHSGLPVRGDQG